MLFEFHFGRVAKFSVYFSLISLLAIGTGSAASQKRNITEKDLWDFVWIGDPQISQDGTRVVFVRVMVNEKKEGYNTSIWSVPVAGSEEPHQLSGRELSDIDGKPEGEQAGVSESTPLKNISRNCLAMQKTTDKRVPRQEFAQ